jgi:hypothetical protein
LAWLSGIKAFHTCHQVDMEVDDIPAEEMYVSEHVAPREEPVPSITTDFSLLSYTMDRMAIEMREMWVQ